MQRGNLPKFNYYLATHTDDQKERDTAFRDGINAGKTAVELQNEKPDGHFWLGANYGGAAEHSTIQGLATVSDIRHEMETVLRLNEGISGWQRIHGAWSGLSQRPEHSWWRSEEGGGRNGEGITLWRTQRVSSFTPG